MRAMKRLPVILRYITDAHEALTKAQKIIVDARNSEEQRLLEGYMGSSIEHLLRDADRKVDLARQKAEILVTHQPKEKAS